MAPSRKRPKVNSMIPDTMASIIAPVMYSALPGSAIGASAAPVIREITATGPTDITMDEPNRA